MGFATRIAKPMVYASMIGSVIGGSILIKDWMGGPNFRSDIRADKKVVIITGANAGIGKETAWELARRGAKVYMVCRDMPRCEETRTEIVLDTKNKYVYCRQCDLSSLESIRKFVDKFNRTEKKLDILINNAGVLAHSKHTKTKEGFEMHLGVNHMGPFLLTNLLLDKLKESAPSRIVNVASYAHLSGTINKEDLNLENKYDRWGAYRQSKLANVLFTKELSDRLTGTGVTANSLHPGVVGTEFFKNMTFANSWLAKIFIKPFIWPFIKSPKNGAQTTLYVALEPSLENVSGKYFSNNEIVEESDMAKDTALSKWLWAVSEKWTRLNTS